MTPVGLAVKAAGGYPSVPVRRVAAADLEDVADVQPQQKLRIGESLLGQCAVEKRRMLISDLPPQSTPIRSGLFEAVVFDLAGTSAAARQRLPGTTWIRLQRLIEDQPTALVLIADGHVSHGPGGAALALKAAAPRWSGSPPARLLRGVAAEVREARRGLRGATVELQACS